jgi:hypothetical protein
VLGQFRHLAGAAWRNCLAPPSTGHPTPHSRKSRVAFVALQCKPVGVACNRATMQSKRECRLCVPGRHHGGSGRAGRLWPGSSLCNVRVHGLSVTAMQLRQPLKAVYRTDARDPVSRDFWRCRHRLLPDGLPRRPLPASGERSPPNSNALQHGPNAPTEGQKPVADRMEARMASVPAPLQYLGPRGPERGDPVDHHRSRAERLDPPPTVGGSPRVFDQASDA